MHLREPKAPDIWCDLVRPHAEHTRAATAASFTSRSPSPTTVAFDLTHKLDGEDVLFALDV